MDFIYRRAQCFQIPELSCAQLYCELVSGCNKYVVSSCIPEEISQSRFLLCHNMQYQYANDMQGKSIQIES